MLPKLNSIRMSSVLISLRISIFLFIIGFFSATAFGADVASETALQVAQGVLQHHLELFGHWNGATAPAVTDVEAVAYDGATVAYNCRVQPSGHILVASADELNPVPLYSTRSDFVPSKADLADTIESWIVPELKGKVVKAKALRARLAASDTVRSAQNNDTAELWNYFKGLSDPLADTQADQKKATDSSTVRTATVAPLLTTIWAQDYPYNLSTPDDDCGSGHTLTGCVATAWAQLLRYWQWPIQGEGSYSYNWDGATTNQTLSVDFSVTYDWANMPDELTGSSSAAEQQAISQLMYHLGVSAEMEYGCDTSGSALWADQILDDFFRYKELNQTNNRPDREHYTAEQWFALIKTELDADPPRPIIFSAGSNAGWHEMVIDGYQEGQANMVHINFGWEGNYDAYYDITDDDDFNTGDTDWSIVAQQVMVIGIEPDNSPPVVNAGDDQSVAEGTTVQATATASDPESVGIRSVLWTQISGPSASINDADSLTTTIDVPDIDSGSAELVFQLRVDDINRAYATDTITITVTNNDDDDDNQLPDNDDDDGGGGSSGGCIISTLLP